MIELELMDEVHFVYYCKYFIPKRKNKFNRFYNKLCNKGNIGSKNI